MTKAVICPRRDPQRSAQQANASMATIELTCKHMARQAIVATTQIIDTTGCLFLRLTFIVNDI